MILLIMIVIGVCNCVLANYQNTTETTHVGHTIETEIVYQLPDEMDF